MSKEHLEQRAMNLEYATIGWNGVEMLIAIGLGIAARSLALVAFGLDTGVELFASGVVLWHLRHPGRDSDVVTAKGGSRLRSLWRRIWGDDPTRR